MCRAVDRITDILQAEFLHTTKDIGEVLSTKYKKELEGFVVVRAIDNGYKIYGIKPYTVKIESDWIGLARDEVYEFPNKNVQDVFGMVDITKKVIMRNRIESYQVPIVWEFDDFSKIYYGIVNLYDTRPVKEIYQVPPRNGILKIEMETIKVGELLVFSKANLLSDNTVSRVVIDKLEKDLKAVYRLIDKDKVVKLANREVMLDRLIKEYSESHNLYIETSKVLDMLKILNG